jgi:uncharacterized protein (TIGR02453 family)
MIPKESIDFLKNLEKNNNRDWFEANKPTFKKRQSEVKDVFEAIKVGLSQSDEIEKLKMFRIYRDVRFSKNKTPYKTHFSGYCSRLGQALRGSYYIHIQPGASFLGVGFWDPNKDDLLRIRKEIELDASEFYEFLKQPDFKNTWGSFTGDTLKTAPRGFEKDHPDIELLRRMNFTFVLPLKDEEVLSPDFVDNTVDAFEKARPFLDLMSDVLTTDLNGESIL